MKIDDGLEDIRRIRGLGGEKLPAVSNALLPNLKNGLFFAIGEGSTNFDAYFLHSKAQMCFIRRLAGARHVSPVVLSTLTGGWVGAPKERTPFRYHGAVVDFVDRCLSIAPNLAASNEDLAQFFSGRSWPKICPGIIFYGAFEKLDVFFKDLCS